ncbi:MAG: Xaa-Pro peptidase family protein [Halobacteriales archaeon]|nr:Xaa-Pro peptidase family protein [Halobacteriales archaeon]
MEPDLSKLDALVRERGVDGYLVLADSDEADQRYLSGFAAPDDFLTLYDGEVHLLVSGLEYGRAKKEARAASVKRTADFDQAAKLREHGETAGTHRLYAEFLDSHGVGSVAVPTAFPLGAADGLREQGIEVRPDRDDTIGKIRATKTETEIDWMRESQRANEKAMATAERMLRDAEPDVDGVLHLDGEVLTSERVRQEIEVSLIRNGCALAETIVACGSQAADPHERGTGPLYEDEPIIVDIFPHSKETGYFADMTRTFCVGEPSETVREWYDLTEEAMDAAFEVLEAGVSGSEVHDAVCDVYEDAGWPTLRADESTETGFIHSTGHGVGLDIHEYPRVSTAENELEAGMVVTVEPGLYDPEVGGVRIEDIVVVREGGFENLTRYDRQLVV